MLTIAHIAARAATGTLASLDDQAVDDACNSVLFARDPAHLGDEPHLRCEVDPCGLDDDALATLEQQVWAERAVREEARHAAIWLQGPPAVLPLAA